MHAWPNRPDPGWAATIAESDRRYFELDAEVHHSRCWSLYAMIGRTDVAAGCVAVHVGGTAGLSDLERQVHGVERHAQTNGAAHCRIYDQVNDGLLRHTLLERGYVPSGEIGMILERPPAVDVAVVRLRPVTSERDWAEKRVLHEHVRVAPDGHEVDADRWVDMERRKTLASGGMCCFLIEREGEVCGAVAAMESGTMLRMKNLVVGAPWRRHGTGAAATLAMAGYAFRTGHRGMGLWALDGGPAIDMYRRLSFVEVTAQTEWVRPL